MTFKSSVLAAKTAAEAEDYAAVLDHCKAALQANANPDNAQFYVLYGKALWKLGDLESAETQLKRATDMNSKLMQAHTILGRLYEAQEKWDQFKSALQAQADIGKPKNIVLIFLKKPDESRTQQASRPTRFVLGCFAILSYWV